MNALASLLMLATVQAPAPAEEKAVLAAVDAFFAAMEKRDENAVLATVDPRGTISAHVNPLRAERWPDWAKRVPQMKPNPVERLHSPEVKISGSLAYVWSRYSFHMDGKFSHCGTDLFDMAKVEGRWRIVNASFTRETEGCREK